MASRNESRYTNVYKHSLFVGGGDSKGKQLLGDFHFYHLTRCFPQMSSRFFCSFLSSKQSLSPLWILFQTVLACHVTQYLPPPLHVFVILVPSLTDQTFSFFFFKQVDFLDGRFSDNTDQQVALVIKRTTDFYVKSYAKTACTIFASTEEAQILSDDDEVMLNVLGCRLTY